MKNKEKAVGVNVSDTKTLHSLQVAKMASDVCRSQFVQYLKAFSLHIHYNTHCQMPDYMHDKCQTTCMQL